MYTPNNLCVYVYAICGYNAGLLASRNQPTAPNEVDYADAADRADFFAQAIDTVWGTTSYTQADLLQIQSAAAALCTSGRSIVPGSAGLTANGYIDIATALIAGIQAGTAQIVSEGLNPDGCGGGGGDKPFTAHTVTSGQTYNVSSTDTAIRFDTTGGSTATAVLPTPTYIGQRITFYWWAWSVAQVAPTINASAGKQFVPFSGQASSGAAGLVTTTTISTPGAAYTLEWNGTEWMSV
jgi:hypothetical protein